MFDVSRAIFLTLWMSSAYVHAFSHDHNYLCVVLIINTSLNTSTFTYMQVSAIYSWHACNHVDYIHFKPCGGVSILCVHSYLVSMYDCSNPYGLWPGNRPEEWTSILNMMYYTDLGYTFLFWEYWSDALVKSSE